LVVLAVIANHQNQTVAWKGYLGVDIFFVISGYVVMSSLLARQATSPLSFQSGIYARRFKRLLAARMMKDTISARRMIVPGQGICNLP
jgi:hypothetical protein